MAEILLAGLDFRTAPVAVRERAAVPEPALREALTTLRALRGVGGVALISTCNRVEVIVSTRSDEALEEIVRWFDQRAGASMEPHLYVLRQDAAIDHLFRVAAGLESMILGEPQIGGQVRNAFQAAIEAQTIDGLLQQLFEQTLRVAKKIRSDTGIGERAVSASYAAVELAKKVFGDLSGVRVLLIGAGEMAELTAEHLHSENVTQVFVANRSHNRAVELAKRYSGHAIHFDGIAEQLLLCDIVIASTGAPHYVISEDHVRRALEHRRNRSLFLIDLSVPRNISPAVANVDGAYVYSIDDLQHVADENLEKRRERAKEAEGIVNHEVAAFKKRLAARDAVPTIVELRQRLETIRTGEVEKYLRHLGPVTIDHKEAVEMLTTQIINKILHYPMLQLKEEPAREPAIRRIFGL